jgi:hypothetical protein
LVAGRRFGGEALYVADTGEERRVLDELTGEHLDVYDTKAGPWNPDHGDLERIQTEGTEQ